MSEPIQAAPRWRPAPFLQASGALHAGAAVMTLLRPQLWPWALGAVALNHAALTAAGLWPRSHWLGPNWIRLPAPSIALGRVAVTIDDGPDPEVTPRVLSLLGSYRVRATFFCVGERVERHADLAREIVRLGHCIENHSQHHRHTFSLLGPRAMHDEILKAQHGIARVSGIEPVFFRAPAGLRNPFLDPVLSRLRLRLAAWTHRGFDTVNGNADQVYRHLTRSLAAGDILLLHDGHAARGRLGTPVIIEVLPRLLETLLARQLEPITLREALT